MNTKRELKKELKENQTLSGIKEQENRAPKIKTPITILLSRIEKNAFRNKKESSKIKGLEEILTYTEMPSKSKKDQKPHTENKVFKSTLFFGRKSALRHESGIIDRRTVGHSKDKEKESVISCTHTKTRKSSVQFTEEIRKILSKLKNRNSCKPDDSQIQLSTLLSHKTEAIEHDCLSLHSRDSKNILREISLNQKNRVPMTTIQVTRSGRGSCKSGLQSSVGKKSTSVSRPSKDIGNLKVSNQAQEVGFDDLMLASLNREEVKYSLQSFPLEKNHPQINWKSRAVVVDWLIEVSTDFLFKRETLYCAVYILDLYLSQTKDLAKEELQLTGLACLFLTSKLEEVFTPKIESFVAVTDNTFTSAQIRQAERIIYTTVNFKVTPPTLHLWAAYYLFQWDRISAADGFAFRYKDPSLASYSHFRELMQIIDCVLLEVQLYRHRSSVLIACFLYLQVGLGMEFFSREQVIDSSSHSLLEQDTTWNKHFGDFLYSQSKLTLEDLRPSFHFACSFFALKTQIDFPTAAKINHTSIYEGTYDDFLNYTTHDPNSLIFTLRTRKRTEF